MAAVTSAISCGTTRTAASVPPSALIRSRIASSDLATIEGLVCGSLVMTRPTRLLRKAATRTSGSLPMMASAFSSTGRGTAKGMTLTVATISRSSTMAKGWTVASVRLSCRRLSARTRSVSTMARPWVVAWRLARPVKGACATVPSAPTRRATAAAASSSGTSSG